MSRSNLQPLGIQLSVCKGLLRFDHLTVGDSSFLYWSDLPLWIPNRRLHPQLSEATFLVSIVSFATKTVARIDRRLKAGHSKTDSENQSRNFLSKRSLVILPRGSELSILICGPFRHWFAVLQIFHEEATIKISSNNILIEIYDSSNSDNNRREKSTETKSAKRRNHQ